MKRKAFTLTEMLAAVVLVVIVASALYMLLKTPADFNSYAQREFDVQADMRHSSNIVDRSIKNASAAFLLTKHDKNFKNDWNYFISEVEDGYSRLVLYEWDGKTHVKKVLSEFPEENLDLKLVFQRETEGGMIKYGIHARDKKNSNVRKIESEVRILNAANIIDESKIDHSLSPPKKNANCLAFRSDRPDPSVSENGYHHIAISFVLDTSGSMSSQIGGGDKNYRMPVLRNVLNTFIDTIYAQDQGGIVDIRIYPFADRMADNLPKFNYLPPSEWDEMIDTTGSYNGYDKFLNVKKRGADFLHDMINSLRSSTATNPGDGLRYAHHGMLQYQKIRRKENSDARIKHYLFVLTDGQPNCVSLGYPETTKKDDKGHDILGPDGKPIIVEGLKTKGNKDEIEVLGTSLGTRKSYGGTSREVYYVKGVKNCVDAMENKSNQAEGYVWAEYDYTHPSDEYIRLISKEIAALRTPGLNEKVDVTVVGFSGSSRDNAKCNMMGRALGAEATTNKSGKKVYYKDCNSKDALTAVFQGFTEAVLNDALWYISGPE